MEAGDTNRDSITRLRDSDMPPLLIQYIYNWITAPDGGWEEKHIYPDPLYQ